MHYQPDYTDFAPRMELAREIAMHRRDRAGGGGGRLISPATRQAMLDAMYEDDDARADYMADQAEAIERAAAEFEALDTAELERFGCDLSGRERAGRGLPAPAHVAIATASARGKAVAERRQRKGLTMKGRAFKRALEQVGLSQYAAAPFLGLSLRQVQRIAAGEYEAPKSVAMLLRLMAAKQLEAADVDTAD